MKIEIWSDIVCPWCYIGKARFEKALLSFVHRGDVEVVWKSYELSPHAPKNTGDTMVQSLAKAKRIPESQAIGMIEHVTQIAKGEGLQYNLLQAKPANTFKAHQLIHMAKTAGIQDQIKERLLSAFFIEELAVDDLDVLVRIATESGLDADEVRSSLESDKFKVAVQEDEQRARMLGIQGVPFFLLNGKLGISGAQSSETFTHALEQAWTEANPLKAATH